MRVVIHRGHSSVATVITKIVECLGVPKGTAWALPEQGVQGTVELAALLSVSTGLHPGLAEELLC